MSGRRSNSGSKDGRFKSTGMQKIAKNATRNQSRGGGRSSIQIQQSISPFLSREEVDKIQGLCVYGQTSTSSSSAKGSRSVGSKNKKRDQSDSDYEEEQKRMATPKSGPPKRGKVANSTENVLKQMKETGESLKKLSKYTNAGGVEIANSLEDLGSTDDENDGSGSMEDNGLAQLGRRIDAHLNSTPMQRAVAEMELSISHECPLYVQIGTLDQVFQLKKPEDLPKSKCGEANTFECIFLARGKWRTSLIDQFKVESKNGIKMDFNNFMVVFCYAFQLRPNQIGVALDGMKMEEEMQMNRLEQMALELDEEKLKAKQQETKDKIVCENIDTFFDLWNDLDFYKCWNEAELNALLRAFCFIYLDEDMVNDREKVELAIANFLDNLAGDEGSDNNQKLDNILFKFGHRGILQCAQEHWNRVICLFSLFADKSKFVQFKARHKLSTTYALLQYVISEKIDDKKKPPARECTLGQVLQLFPEAIECLKERNDATALHCVYTKLMDELTSDEQMLNNQSDESLRQASENFNATSSSLNKRDINQKMVDMWSETGHRIRQTIQNRRNAAIIENQKAEAKKANKYYGGCGLGSSSEEEDEDE